MNNTICLFERIKTLESVLSEALIWMERASPFYKYQKPGREFSPSREEIEGCIGRTRVLLANSNNAVNGEAEYRNKLEKAIRSKAEELFEFNRRSGSHGIEGVMTPADQNILDAYQIISDANSAYGK